MNIRPPAVAGSFYPADPLMLQKKVTELLAKAKHFKPFPKAIVVPHAGFTFSGPIASSAYAGLINQKNTINKIVILGPAHTMHFKGVAYNPVTYFSTPLGEIKQDKTLLDKIINLPFVQPLEAAHAKEHCLEVQLPFCQLVFSKFTILPLLVGETSELDVALLLDQLWGNEDTLIIISSDLSHYHPYDIAQKEDSKTIFSIDTLDAEAIVHESACGYYPLRGFLHYARQHNLRGLLLDARNSGDTAGGKDKVVGYAAYHFYQDLKFGDYCKRELLNLAKKSLQTHAIEGKRFLVDYKEHHDLLKVRAPTFVTLKKQGVLRGCIGSLRSKEYLGDSVVHNAIRAGFADPRFPNLERTELSELSVIISILSPLAHIEFTDEEDFKAQLQPGRDGVVLICDKQHATFLPAVWDELDNTDDFIKYLKIKMGLPSDYWSEHIKALKYTVETIAL